MDQMASALGHANQLLALLCQPAEVQESVAIPKGIAFWGIDSGIRHSVGGSDYGSVRVAAFMGLKIISDQRDSRSTPALTSSVAEAATTAASCQSATGQPAFGGYLANVTPSRFMQTFEQSLPHDLSGGSFLQQHSHHYDTVTSVQPGQTYAVRTATAHPIHEHFRVQAFRQLLPTARHQDASRAVLGELMMQSHASYGACGLGSSGTDRCEGWVIDAP